VAIDQFRKCGWIPHGRLEYKVHPLNILYCITRNTCINADRACVMLRQEIYRNKGLLENDFSADHSTGL
jgi:hypothetical protein